MKNLIITIFVFIFFACQKEYNSSICIASKISQFKRDAVKFNYPFAIFQTEFQGETIFHFNDNQGNYYLRENCDTMFYCKHNYDCTFPKFSKTRRLIWRE